MKVRNLLGRHFKRWRVVAFAGVVNKKRRWKCICDCGIIRTVTTDALISGISGSCGCLQKEAASKHNRTHGLNRTPEHNSWGHMKQRCLNKKCANYSGYGGRGIKICKRWLKFENFISDMGKRPGPRFTIERIDNDGDYKPGNCRWATHKEQVNNQGSNTMVTLDGITKNVSQWALEIGVSAKLLNERLRHGWNVEEAFSIPRGYRFRPYCRNGHVLTADNVKLNSIGVRMCIKCSKEWSKKHRDRNLYAANV